MNRAKIKELIELVEQSDIAELEVHFFGGRKVVIRKGGAQNQIVFPQMQNSPSLPLAQSSQGQSAQPVPQAVGEKSPEQAKAADAESKYRKIESPMVGIFYRKPSPDSQPYVELGAHLAVGQVVCLIEAMKLFNEVKSEISGTIRKILVEDASPVEYGQVLLLVEPD